MEICISVGHYKAITKCDYLVTFQIPSERNNNTNRLITIRNAVSPYVGGGFALRGAFANYPTFSFLPIPPITGKDCLPIPVT